MIARVLQPAIVVLEDCDLVAADRDFSPSGAPLLFEVLDALDGLDSDSDVTFLLTTNRVDILEEALVERPGRVDLAIEIPLPDRHERERLLELYRRDVPFSDEALAVAAERTHLERALDLLLSERESLTRRLLGVEDEDILEATQEQGWMGARTTESPSHQRFFVLR